MLLPIDAFDFADFYFRQQRRFLVQIIRHRRQAGRDDAADVIAPRIHHVKRDRRAEIHDDHRRAKMKLSPRPRLPDGPAPIEFGFG